MWSELGGLVRLFVPIHRSICHDADLANSAVFGLGKQAGAAAYAQLVFRVFVVVLVFELAQPLQRLLSSTS